MGSDKGEVDEETVETARGKGGQAPAPASVETDVAELSKLSTQLDEYKNKVLYMQADFENYRKRVEREKAEFRATANEGLIMDLLDVYENLERALDASKKGDAQAPQILKGLEMVYGEMKAVLGRYGLKPIDAVGKKFDPHTMEAMMQEVATDADDDTVLDEFQRGYTLGSKVIRCSKVKVSKR
jgi:Molecular chaperone GrpE (heat shock protein)